MADDLIRLSKLMTERGLCSRREADRLIEQGEVLVDGKTVSILGTKVLPSAKIELTRKGQKQRDSAVTILLHKPIGYVSGQPEDDYEPAVVLVRPENQDLRQSEYPLQREHMIKLAPAGRLDIDSTGLLVFTQDGRIAKQLVGENSEVEKEYLVRVRGRLEPEQLKLLNHGLSLDDKPLKPAQVRWLNPDQLQFILREGRKRQIRRMCELMGLEITGLKRVRIGRVPLRDLAEGKWRFLQENEEF